METLKNLANCTPREFIRQTAKIRRSVQEWLTLTDIHNIRKRMPDLKDSMSVDEKRDALKTTASRNINAILDAILEDHPDETIDLLGLCCFIEPEDLDNHTTEELLGAMSEMLGSEAVVRFFTSLVRLVQTGILTL